MRRVRILKLNPPAKCRIARFAATIRPAPNANKDTKRAQTKNLAIVLIVPPHSHLKISVPSARPARRAQRVESVTKRLMINTIAKSVTLVMKTSMTARDVSRLIAMPIAKPNLANIARHVLFLQSTNAVAQCVPRVLTSRLTPLATDARRAIMAILTAKRLLTHRVSVVSLIVKDATKTQTNATIAAHGRELPSVMEQPVVALTDTSIMRNLERVA